MADGDTHEQYKNRNSSYLIRIPCISHSISFHMLLLRSRLGVGGKVSQEIFKWNSALLVIDYKLTLREEFLTCELFTWKQCIFASLGQRSWSGKGEQKTASSTEVGRYHKEMPDCGMYTGMGDALHTSFWEVTSDVPTSTAHPVLHKYLMWDT